MLRFVLFVLIGVVVYLLLRGPRRRPPFSSSSQKAERIVPCAVCGVHLPEGESISHSGRYYCCEAHRKQDVEC